MIKLFSVATKENLRTRFIQHTALVCEKKGRKTDMTLQVRWKKTGGAGSGLGEEKERERNGEERKNRNFYIIMVTDSASTKEKTTQKEKKRKNAMHSAIRKEKKMTMWKTSMLKPSCDARRTFDGAIFLLLNERSVHK